ncbi:MAG: ADP-forming succinate--CoA ligase subunit beta [Alphaproteobacteria bacterium]
MNIHEYQAKQLLREYSAPIPDGGVAYTPEEAVQVAQDLGGDVWVVKAQIHAGGRGKGGGVKVAKSIEEVRQYASDILGMTLVTPQTSSQGQLVKRIYIEQGCNIARELYFSILIDRKTQRYVAMASTEGGMDIEEVAAKNPKAIVKVMIDPITGLQPFHARKIAFGLGLSGQAVKDCTKFIQGAFRMFQQEDASQIEINPLVETKDGRVMALDAKVNFDDNALFRHPKIEELRDLDEENAIEREANEHELSYIKLDGNIGCMVNGAGLAMATMDVIKLYGGEPANFLDVGGGATRERVAIAFKLILSDPHVEAILVNIFGGIMRCDVIADGIVAAAKDVGITVPLVVRLEGTNVELGKKILANSGLPIRSADNLGDAASQAVQAVREAA